MRRAVFLVVVALVAAACGEAGPLDGVGDVAGRWVHGGTTTTTEAVIEPVGGGVEGVLRARSVLWFNDDLPDQVVGSPEVVVAGVWARRRNSRFIQASRREIAAALPAIRFPEVVPSDVRWITSQLVYDEATGTLDLDTAAAFGLWRVEPYTIPEGRLAVLRVGIAPPEAGPERSAIVDILVPDGISLGWTEGGLRYELFCRSRLSEELCRAVAESTVPLASLLPEDA